MTPSKRLFDLTFALLLSVLFAPVILLIALWLVLREGGPVFFISERMKGPDTPFRLVKFRTMRPDARDSGVSGGDKAARITPTGRWLRRTRADELPQLWNVLRGDMSFVGPRPPLRRYVEAFPDIYAQVLTCRPGLTGLATVEFHRHEARLLHACATPRQTEAVYVTRCIPAKARLDLLYRRKRSFGLDMLVILRTFSRRVPLRIAVQPPVPLGKSHRVA